MRQRPRVAVFLVVILTLPMLGCVGTESADISQRTTEVEPPVSERLADCLAEMFPQMSRDELERHAQQQMKTAGDTKNAEAFVEKFCGDGDGSAQLAPTDVAIPTSDAPASTSPSKPDSVHGLGVSRAEMEDFFRNVIAQDDGVTFTVVRRTGRSKITEARWGLRNRRNYAALVGTDDDLHGIIFTYEGSPRAVAKRMSDVVRKISPEHPPDQVSPAGWVLHRVWNMNFGGGGGLSNVLPTSRSHREPRPVEDPCDTEGRCFIQDGVEIMVAGIHGVLVLRIRSVEDNTTAE